MKVAEVYQSSGDQVDELWAAREIADHRSLGPDHEEAKRVDSQRCASEAHGRNLLNAGICRQAE
jgi:hypothetical protein